MKVPAPSRALRTLPTSLLLVLALAALAAPALGLDPNSLEAVKSGAAVLLQWSDPTPTNFCVLRGAAAPPAAVVVGVLVWLGLWLREPRLRALLPFRKPPA